MLSIWLTLLATLSFLGGGVVWLGREVKRQKPKPESEEDRVYRLRRIKTSTIAGRRKYLEECRKIAAEVRRPNVLD